MLSVPLGGLAHAEDGGVQAAGYVTDHAQSGVEQVSYTVSESGHRYKWTPYQPKQTKRKVEPLRAEAAQYNALTPPETTESKPHPLDDPFGDRQPALPILPDMEQFLADDTNKKLLPLDGLMPPTTNEQDSIGEPLPQVPLDNLDELPRHRDLDRPDRGHTQICQSPKDNRLIPPMDKLDHLTGIRNEKMLSEPKNLAPESWPQECGLDGGDFVPRQWASTNFMWQASGLCHKPAYFEDVHLERYGHSWGPYVQPLMSGAHFFLNVPILPYKMGLYPPGECIYTLGYYRPGSCAPYMLDPLPLSIRAGLAQAGATVGMAYLIP